ncbi:PREDICTED: protein odr-4 homolog isoform X2 [Lepidothrix coronata]|uniref:Protein odr-4 homolog n=1 Tax=Lepidothrix coronata TaxID=321398 RepID=A0A6J0IWM7_9PASS|nr:PREDICTED: protein odr-4 homolog isoform X2 [Lepidothrix coronata]
MGRTYLVEEGIGQYLSELSTAVKPYVTGLLIGQCSPQRDYVIRAVRTPPKDQHEEQNSPPKLASLDEEWITTHASQVSRMLPGGLLVLGVFMIASPELAKDGQNALRKQRVVCRTYDVQDPKSSAKPADWKYQSALSASWLALGCTVNVNIHIPLLATSPNHDLEKNTKNGLNRWSKQIEDSVFLINGQVKDDDTELLEGQKKSRGNTQSSTQFSDVKVLTQLCQGSSHRSTATVQVCSGSINLRGAVKCRAYIHNNRPRVKEAIQALKRDIINTLSDRCEILFEDLILNEGPQKKSFEREYHVLPQRLFVPVPGSSVMLSDYKFGDEAAGEIQERFVELLDQAVQAEEIHTAEGISTVDICPVPDNLEDTQQTQLTKATLLLKLQQNMGVVVAAAVAILASIFSFNYFSD